MSKRTLVLAVFGLLILIGAVSYKANSTDRAAKFERIDISPLNYMSKNHLRTEFYHKLNLGFEQQRKLMDRKSNVVKRIAARRGEGDIVKIEKVYVLICLNESCLIFSDNLLSEKFVRKVINDIDH